MTNPSISVIMPVFNGAQYIGEAINSVISQSLQPIELIIVDDGSTDGSRELAESVETPFPKIVLHQANKRQAAARNFGTQHACGKYIAYLDHDDIWHPRHLEKLVEPLEESSIVGWSYSDIDEMDSGGGLISLNSLAQICPSAQHPKRDVFNMLSGDMFIFPSAALVRRDAVLSIGGFDERLSGYEDDDLFLRLFRAGWLNTYLPEALVRYRRHPASSAFSERMWISRDIFANKLLETYPDDPVLVRFYVRDIIAPRFYRSAFAEYIRHFPHGRWEQCLMALELMRRFTRLSRPTFGMARLRRFILLTLLSSPRLFAAIYPYIRGAVGLPRVS